jgi:hypothetical protein
MKNDKEKLEKLFNLLKDGMDMLTNDGNGLHIGVSAIIRNGDDSYFSIKDANDERNNRIYFEGTPNEVIDKTLRTFYSLGRDGKNLENLDFGEEFKEYKEAGKELWGYPVLDQQYLIGEATPLEVIKDINFETGLENFALSIDSLRTRDYDNSRWNIFAKEGNQILDVNDINKIGIDNVVKLFTDKESALEVIKEFGRELKPIENLEVLEDREQNSFYDPAKSNDGGGYHQPYLKISFDIDNTNYTLIKDDTSCGDFGVRIDTQLLLTDNNQKIYEYHLDTVKRNSAEDEEYLSVNKELMTKELWENLIYNDEINSLFVIKNYDELIDEPKYGLAVLKLPENDLEIDDFDLIENNSFHFKKDFENNEFISPRSLVFKKYDEIDFDEDDNEEIREEHVVYMYKENNENFLIDVTHNKDMTTEIKFALEEDMNFEKPFVKIKGVNADITEIKAFEHIHSFPKEIGELLNFSLDNSEKIPTLIDLARENGEHELGNKYIKELKFELYNELNKNSENNFVTFKKMNNSLDKILGEIETPLAITNLDKVEKIKDFLIEKVEEQKTVNAEGYKGYDLDNFNLNFTMIDTGISKYTTVKEYEKDKEKDSKEKEIDY